MEDILNQIASQLYAGDCEAVAELTQSALESGLGAEVVLSRGLMAGMDLVGRDFKSGEMFVPEVLISARAMHAGMDILRPLLSSSSASSAGTYVIGTVKGDLHDIGKSLVKLMLEGAGFVGIDLGTDVPAERFVEAVKQHQPNLLAMSSLLTTTMTEMRKTIQALEMAGIRDQVKVVVGGAPVTLDYARQIGADGYAPDAARAVDVARSLVS